MIVMKPLYLRNSSSDECYFIVPVKTYYEELRMLRLEYQNGLLDDLGVRHFQAILLFFCLSTNYNQQGGINLVSVILHEGIKEFRQLDINYKIDRRKTVDILNGFYYGYCISVVIGGYLGTKINTKHILVINGIYGAFSSYASPTIIKSLGWNYFWLVRLTQGIFQGFVTPQVYFLISRWIPPSELIYLGPMILSGAISGMFFICSMGGFLATSRGGWESIFYFAGNCGIVWCLAFAGLGSTEPDSCWYISKEEKDFINNALKTRAKGMFRKRVPWKEVIKSKPLYAIAVSFFVQSWCEHVLFTFTPAFIHEYFDCKFNTVGLLVSGIYLLFGVVFCSSTYLATVLLKKKKIKIKELRYGTNSIGQWGFGVFLLLASNSDSLVDLMALLTLGLMLNSNLLMGVYVSPFDLSPNFAGLLCGWMSGLAYTAQLIGPFISNLVVTHSDVDTYWRIIYFVCGLLCIFGNLVFVSCGSVELQDYNSFDDESNGYEQ